MFFKKDFKIELQWDLQNEGLRLHECFNNFHKELLKYRKSSFNFHVVVSVNTAPNLFNAYKNECSFNGESFSLSGLFNPRDTYSLRIVEGYNSGQFESRVYEICYANTFENQSLSLVAGDTYSNLHSKNTSRWVDKLNLKNKDLCKIGFFGDSITWGTIHNSEIEKIVNIDDNNFEWTNTHYTALEPYPKVTIDVLNRLFKEERFSYVNKALPGQTAKTMYESWWIESDFDVVIIKLGTNDCHEEYFNDMSEYIKYMSLLIERYIRHGCMVVLCDSIYSQTKYGKKYIGSSRTAIRQLANNYSISIMDFSTLSENLDRNCFVDGLHPSDHGYNIMGTSLAAFLCGDHFLCENKNRAEEGIFLKAFLETTTMLNDVTQVMNGVSISPLPGPYDELNGSQMNIKPGCCVEIPIYVKDDSLYVFPSIVFGNTASVIQNASFNMTINGFKGHNHLAVANSNRWRDNFVDESIGKWTRSYSNYSVDITPDKLNFHNKTSYSMEGCLLINAPINDILSVQGRGWQLLQITNTGSEIIGFYGVQFMNEMNYYLHTKVQPKRFTLDKSEI